MAKVKTKAKATAAELHAWCEENDILGTPKEMDAFVATAMKKNDPLDWIENNWDKPLPESPAIDPEPEVPTTAPPTEAPLPEVVNVTINVPIALCDLRSPTLARPHYLGVRLRDFESKAAVASMRVAMRQNHVAMSNGQPIVSNANVIQYILEQISEQLMERVED